MTQPPPDLFHSVHKGIRAALFAACTALGRAPGDAAREAESRALLAEALHFVAHHGENEDRLLLPLLDTHAPPIAVAMRSAHEGLEESLRTLLRDAPEAPIEDLDARAQEFLARYLDHMRDEERVWEPTIRDELSNDELLGFGRESVARTAPHDQRMMLGWMIRAMTRAEAAVLLARLPRPLAEAMGRLAA